MESHILFVTHEKHYAPGKMYFEKRRCWWRYRLSDSNCFRKKNGTEIICIEWLWCRCYTIQFGFLWCVRKVGISFGINCLTQGKIAESNRHSFLHWKKKFVESTNLVVAECHSRMLLSIRNSMNTFCSCVFVFNL